MRRRALLLAATASPVAMARAGKSQGASLAKVVALIADWQRKDVEAVLARVADDIVWYSHVGSPAIRGKAAMRTFLQSMAAGITDIRWRIHHHAVSGNQIFMEGVDDFVLVKEQRRVALPYLGIMVFKAGLISEWRDYFDRALFDRLKAGDAAPPDIAALADRPGVP